MAARTPVELLLAWPAKLAEEVLLAPWTIAKVRRSLTELPQEIERLSATLQTTTGMLAGSLPAVEAQLAELRGDLTGFREALEGLLPELSRVVTGMDDRFQHVEAMVGELGDALLNVMGAIPGVRRALRPSAGTR